MNTQTVLGYWQVQKLLPAFSGYDCAMAKNLRLDSLTMRRSSSQALGGPSLKPTWINKEQKHTSSSTFDADNPKNGPVAYACNSGYFFTPFKSLRLTVRNYIEFIITKHRSGLTFLLFDCFFFSVFCCLIQKPVFDPVVRQFLFDFCTV